MAGSSTCRTMSLYREPAAQEPEWHQDRRIHDPVATAPHMLRPLYKWRLPWDKVRMASRGDLPSPTLTPRSSGPCRGVGFDVEPPERTAGGRWSPRMAGRAAGQGATGAARSGRASGTRNIRDRPDRPGTPRAWPPEPARPTRPARPRPAG